MTREAAVEYAIKEIPNILPLETDDIKALCNQVLTDKSNSPDQIAESFMEILGHEELVFDFVIKFNELLSEKPKTDNVKPLAPKEIKKSLSDNSTQKEPINIQNNLKTTNDVRQINQNSSGKKNTVTHKNDHGVLLSSKLDEPYKTTKKEGVNKQQRTGLRKNKKIQSLEEIDDVVKLLEIEKDNKDTNGYICNCQAKRHPLFELVPNCLSCGKIICVKEGLHLNNCSFCGEELIPVKERLEIMEYLNKEKEDIENNKVADTSSMSKKKPSKTYKISTGMGKNMFEEHDKLMNFLEKQQEREKKRKEVLEQEEIKPEAAKDKGENSELQEAQERLNRLLHFQDTSAERTKIIDNASDFNMSDNIGVWGSAKERALLLKKQQRNLKKWEQLEKERNGRKDKYVVSMNIGTNGKVTMSEVVKDNVFKPTEEDLDAISDEEDLKDVKEIKNLEQYITQEKHSHIDNSLSNVWDFEKDKKKFSRPVYVSTNQINEEDQQNDGEMKSWKNRVQITQDDDGSLEQNILAVL